MLPVAGHSQGKGGSQGAGTWCKTLFVSRQHLWKVGAEPVLGAPRAEEGQGWGTVAARGAVHGGNLYHSQGLRFPCLERVQGGPSRPNARPVSAMPMLQCPEAPAWDPPRKAEPAKGKGASRRQPCLREGRPVFMEVSVQPVERRLEGKVKREAGSGPSGRRAQLEAGPGAKSRCQRAAWTA